MDNETVFRSGEVASTNNSKERNPRSTADDEATPLSSASGIPKWIDEQALGDTSSEDKAAGAKDTLNSKTDAGDQTPTAADDPAPFSEALHIPTLISSSKPEDRAKAGKPESGNARKSGSGWDPAAPLSSALGIPTLIRDKPSRNRGDGEKDISSEAAPFSSALGIPTLINESKPKHK